MFEELSNEYCAGNMIWTMIQDNWDDDEDEEATAEKKLTTRV